MCPPKTLPKGSSPPWRKERIKISKNEFREELLDLLRRNSYIEPEILKEKNIKRGLRNSDGTGVLVGATRVASVEGYQVQDGQIKPMEGKLLYRGIPIDDIVDGIWKDKRFGYEEVIFLLLFGELPDANSLEKFNQILDDHMVMPKDFLEDVILKIPSPNVMNLMQRVILALYAFDDKPEDLSLDNQLDQAIRIIAKMPLIVAYSYMCKRYNYDRESLVIHEALKGVSIAENMLHLTRLDSGYTREEAELLDISLIVHAEHGGGNNSAFANHVVSSSGTDFYSSISTSIGSLKGPKHGGANYMVEAMVIDLKENTGDWTDKANVRRYLEAILDKEAFDRKGLIYGMGHAIYTKTDPRAVLLEKKLGDLVTGTDFEADFELLQNIEGITRDLFKERKNGMEICANVDLYSGLVYRTLGIHQDLYTPIFALARTPGWCAHRLEQVQDGKIIRPAYLNLVEEREYTPLESR